MTEQTGHLWAVIQEWQDAQPWKPPSQRELAERIGVSHSTVTDWKYARTFPNPRDLKELAKALRVPYERVLDAALQDADYRDPPSGKPERESG